MLASRYASHRHEVSLRDLHHCQHTWPQPQKYRSADKSILCCNQVPCTACLCVLVGERDSSVPAQKTGARLGSRKQTHLTCSCSLSLVSVACQETLRFLSLLLCFSRCFHGLRRQQMLRQRTNRYLAWLCLLQSHPNYPSCDYHKSSTPSYSSACGRACHGHCHCLDAA